MNFVSIFLWKMLRRFVASIFVKWSLRDCFCKQERVGPCLKSGGGGGGLFDLSRFVSSEVSCCHLSKQDASPNWDNGTVAGWIETMDGRAHQPDFHRQQHEVAHIIRRTNKSSLSGKGRRVVFIYRNASTSCPLFCLHLCHWIPSLSRVLTAGWEENEKMHWVASRRTGALGSIYRRDTSKGACSR